MENIRRLESEARSYSMSFPVLSEKAKDAQELFGATISCLFPRQYPLINVRMTVSPRIFSVKGPVCVNAARKYGIHTRNSRRKCTDGASCAAWLFHRLP